MGDVPGRRAGGAVAARPGGEGRHAGAVAVLVLRRRRTRSTTRCSPRAPASSSPESRSPSDLTEPAAGLRAIAAVLRRVLHCGLRPLPAAVPAHDPRVRAVAGVVRDLGRVHAEVRRTGSSAGHHRSPARSTCAPPSAPASPTSRSRTTPAATGGPARSTRPSRCSEPHPSEEGGNAEREANPMMTTTPVHTITRISRPEAVTLAATEYSRVADLLRVARRRRLDQADRLRAVGRARHGRPHRRR